VLCTPGQIDASLIRDFLSRLYQQGVGHTTLARKLASLRSFLHFLQQQDTSVTMCQAGAVAENPSTVANVLPIDQVFALLDTHDASTALSLRDQASGIALREWHTRQ